MYNQKTINAWAEDGDKPNTLMELSICFNQQYPKLIKDMPFGSIYQFLKQIERELKSLGRNISPPKAKAMGIRNARTI